MTAEEKWNTVVKFCGIMNNPKSVTTFDVIGMNLRPSKLGNGAKYLMMKDLEAHLDNIPEQYYRRPNDKSATLMYHANDMDKWIGELKAILDNHKGYEKQVLDNWGEG